MKSALVLVGLLAVAFTTGCSSAMKKKNPPPDLSTVSSVDLDRYMGRWHVIAYVPNFFENGKVATSDNYAKRPDGKMDNIYAFRRKTFDAPEKEWSGVAWVTNTQTNAEWKVKLIWPFTNDYQILELDPKYRWAVVASNKGDLVWILARERKLPSAVYEDLLERIDRRGLNSSRLARVPQPAS